MPTLQSTYSERMPRAYAGMIADARPRTICSRTVETAAGIGFGVVAVQGTAEGQIRLSFAGGKYVGITQADPTLYASNPDVYPQYEVAAVMQKGAIWVVSSVAMAPGDLVYFVPATGVITNVSSSNTLIPNAVAETVSTIGGLVRLYLG